MRLRYFNFIGYLLLLLAAGWLVGCSYSSSFAGGGAPSNQKPTKIALLLPLQGSIGASGQAVRNGFLTAYYYAKQQQSNAPTVDVIDTSGGNVVGLYQQAVAQGADFIVGPLSKDNLQTLVGQGKLTVPTLALNTLDNGGAIKNLYQFGLSPKDEAAQAAMQARSDGRQRALVIYPGSAFGQGIAGAFEKSWKNHGGSIVGNYAYQSNTNLSGWVRGVMGVRRGSKVSSGRQDMDMIFLVGFPEQARQIMPLLAYYNGDKIPVYATSLVYSGNPNPQNDRDLNGIQFSDMPWILGPDTPQWSEMRAHIQSLWGNSYSRFPRLYAFGIDAYHLTYRLGSSVKGATGELSLDSDQHIRRQLQWAQIQNGVPQVLH
ncbi:MAG TPA: penicillin-binding protein activator [Gammaproteobacteria bacterium]|nr:penicillin-binding protein activator [Gammaproteobacteria bacterium]